MAMVLPETHIITAFSEKPTNHVAVLAAGIQLFGSLSHPEQSGILRTPGWNCTYGSVQDNTVMPSEVVSHE